MAIRDLRQIGVICPSLFGNLPCRVDSNLVDIFFCVHKEHVLETVGTRIALCYPSVNSFLRVLYDSKLLLNPRMDNKELRRQHLLRAIDAAGSIEKLAATTETNPKHLSQLKNGTRGMGPRIARQMEKHLGLPPSAWDQPLGSDYPQANHAPHNVSEGPILSRSVPLISFVSAGNLCQTEDPYPPGDAEKWIETYIKVTEGMYALKVEGDSMTNPLGSPSFTEGMIIIVDPTKRAENGAMVIARDGEGKATFKKLSIDGDRSYLVPLNPRYDPIPIQKELHICGVVVAAQIDLR